MQNNSFAEQDTVTVLRTKLRNSVYNDFRFELKLKDEIRNRIPTFNYEYDYSNASIKITIDKNACEPIPGFVHKKEFYMPLIHEALMATYHAMLIIYTTNETASYLLNIMEETIYACKNTICSYKMFDVTPILDNAIMIYL